MIWDEDLPVTLSFEDLYRRIEVSAETGEADDVLRKLQYDPFHLECVLKPGQKPEAWKSFHPDCPQSGGRFADCFFRHIKRDESGNWVQSLGNGPCPQCLDAAKMETVLRSPDLMKTLEAIREGSRPVYALIAPAFLSQFDVVTDGQLRSAFKQLGFQGVVEVSLFADILTLKEALEFDARIHDEQDYVLTSCCCPMWLQMIRKLHPELLSHVPKSVSPMVATGRVIKKMVPDAFTVFIGPCLAKKAEAREEDIKDAVDVVLTFREAKDIFNAAKIDPDGLKTDVREHSSTAGRLYAVSSGVSLAVELTLRRLRPFKPIQVKSVFASGVPECKELIKNLENGILHANGIEGMGCQGGCVGGPRALIEKDTAKRKVREYARKSMYPTPIDNPYVIEMLRRLGIGTVEQLLDDREIFTRHF
ncbi:MAG TPA: [Fe-Fe] hydrogenase large subunit C-terminal domain-containing protein [Bacillota bacterium]|nr:[Fe-Fe] hydrogenase large subunit C-terminal domain-containing protein [Bacillota bacterium]